MFFVSNIKLYRSKKFVRVLYFTGLFFCLTFTIPNEFADADAYRDLFVKYHNSNIGFNDFLNTIYDNHKDPIMPTITFLASKITNNYHILFLFYGLLFVFYYVRFYDFLINNFEIGKNLWLFLVLLFIIPIWQINGFRMWTATYAFVYALILKNERKHVLSLFHLSVAVLTHVSLTPFVIIILFSRLIVLIPERILFYLFMASFLIGPIDILNFIDLDFLPKILKLSLEGYTNENYIQELKNIKMETNFYVKYKEYILFYPFVLVLAYGFLRFKISFKNSILKLILMSNILINVLLTLEVGAVERFYHINNLFLGILILYLFSSYKIPLLFKKLVFFISFFYILIEFRFGIDYIGLDFVFSNPLIALLFHSEIAFSALLDLMR